MPPVPTARRRWAVRLGIGAAVLVVIAGALTAVVTTSSSAPPPPTPAKPTVFDNTDLNCDSYDDFLVQRHSDNALVLLARTKHATAGSDWAPPQEGTIADAHVSSEFTSFTLAGDLNNQETPDLVAQKADGSLWYVPGDCSGSFDTSAAVRVASDTGQLTPIGDFDDDGNVDLLSVSAYGLLWLLPGDGMGGFGARHLVGTGWHTAIGAGDVNGDGFPDLIDRRADGELDLFTSDGKGSWTKDTANATHGLPLTLRLPPQEYPSVIPDVRVKLSAQPDLTAITADGHIVVFQAQIEGPPGSFLSQSCGIGRDWTGKTFRNVADAVPMPGGDMLGEASAPHADVPSANPCTGLTHEPGQTASRSSSDR